MTPFCISQGNSKNESTLHISERDGEQQETRGNKSNIHEISMIVETEEGHQPDLSEIIRSLDTPPPS